MKKDNLISERRFKYLSKMKSAILMALLLISSVFIGAFVAAEGTNLVDTDVSESELIETSSVEVSDIEVTGTDSEDVEEIIGDVETLNKHKKIGFVVVRHGNGWIENGEDGRLINLFWVSQRFLKNNKNETSDEISDSKNVVKTRGSVHISGAGNYALIPMKNYTEESEEIGFYLVPLKKGLFDKHPSIEDLIDMSVGTLVLQVEEKYDKLTVFSGKLNLEEGNAEGEWEVSLATNVKRVKPVVFTATQDAKNAAKKTFWEKMQFWKENKPKNTADSKIKVIADSKPKTTAEPKNLNKN